MSRFIGTKSGRFVNLDSVDHFYLSRTDSGETAYALYMKSGLTYIADRTFDPLDIGVTVVPAEPGFSGLVPVHDEQGVVEDFIRYPVIAWRILPETFQDPQPVCIGTDAVVGVMLPDGRVESLSQTYGDYESFRLDFIALSKADRARRGA